MNDLLVAWKCCIDKDLTGENKVGLALALGKERNGIGVIVNVTARYQTYRCASCYPWCWCRPEIHDGIAGE
jgi:hypothetical protein